MTGMELMEGLSYVDERYIAEADTARLRRGIPWMKVLSVAACLCILIVGAFALDHVAYKGTAPEAAPEAAAPEAAPEAVPEAAPEAEQIPPYPAQEEIPADEWHQIPYARLRVTKVLKEGSFEAVAEATEDMQMDTQVKVSIKEGTVWDPADVVEGAVFEVWDSSYDPEQNILYVIEIQLAEE